MTNKELGGRLRTLRIVTNLTQTQVANILGVSQPTVHGWERGAWPRLEILRGLAGLYGVTLATLLAEPARRARRVRRVG